jgi:hypothetical protein
VSTKKCAHINANENGRVDMNNKQAVSVELDRSMVIIIHPSSSQCIMKL